MDGSRGLRSWVRNAWVDRTVPTSDRASCAFAPYRAKAGRTLITLKDKAHHDPEPKEARHGFWLRFLRLAGPYFNSEERWIARSLLVGVIALTLLQIAIAVRLNIWNKDFFNALDKRDWNLFLGQMGTFAMLLAAAMGI